MKALIKSFNPLFFSILLLSVYADSQESELKKGPITLAATPAEVWGSYKIKHMLFPNEQWEFYVILVAEDVRQGALIEMARDFYSKFPNTRARFFSDKQHIKQYLDRDIYLNDKTGQAIEVEFPNPKWVQSHLLGNINNRSSQYDRLWMLENRYGSMIVLLP